MASITLNFDADQGALLVNEYEIDTTEVCVVTNDAINASAPVNGYSMGPGAYMLFLDGDQVQHESFLTTMFGADKCYLEAKVRNLHLYGTPASKHTKPENKVTVVVAP